MDYKCDMCGKPATVHITKIINGKKTKLHLCQECAQKGSSVGEGFPAQILPNIKKLEEQILDIARPKRSEPVCPKCGMTLSAFDKLGRFACPECYAAFASKVEDMLAHMHGAVAHKGKQPRHHAAQPKASLADGSPQMEMEFFKKPSPGPEASAQEPKFEPAPASPEEMLTELKSALAAAIKDERYEDAARIRDEINRLEHS